MDQTTSGWAEFKGDLKLALSVWGKAPALPAISLSLLVLTFIPPPWAALMIPVGIFMLGWSGTERIWYLRIYRGLSITPGELWKLTWAFLGRFFVLGLLGALAILPVTFFAGLLTAESFGRRTQPAPLKFLIPILVATIIGDVLITFVTPALAYTTRRVGTALRIGVGMLRAEWPRSAWYALIPPLALVIATRWEPVTAVPSSAQLAFSGASILLNLWFKGATAAFYLRRHEVGDWGGAFEESAEATAAKEAPEPEPTEPS